jgi:hypothetical protein
LFDDEDPLPSIAFDFYPIANPRASVGFCGRTINGDSSGCAGVSSLGAGLEDSGDLQPFVEAHLNAVSVLRHRPQFSAAAFRTSGGIVDLAPAL